MRKIFLLTLVGFATYFITLKVSAHGIWIANRVDQKQIILGEGPLDNGYNPDTVKQIHAYTNDWTPSSVIKKEHSNYVTIEPADKTSVVTIDFDYGYWTQNADGKYVNLPMNQVQGANVGIHAIKYSVNYLSSVTNPKIIKDIPLQIVPKIDPTKLNRGDTLPITVYKDGQPLANVPVIIDVVNNLDQTIKTNNNGEVDIIVPNQGLNVIGVEIGFPIKNKKLATQDKFFTTLVFTLIPEE